MTGAYPDVLLDRLPHARPGPISTNVALALRGLEGMFTCRRSVRFVEKVSSEALAGLANSPGGPDCIAMLTIISDGGDLALAILKTCLRWIYYKARPLPVWRGKMGPLMCGKKV